MTNIRRTSGFFDWPVKETKELGIVREWLKADPTSEGIVEVRPGRPDPPDAIGKRADGTVIAIEVTEVVDQKVLENNARALRTGKVGDLVHRVWTEDTFRAQILERLKTKDGLVLNGGPFAEFVVVLHCDETFAGADDVSKWLSGYKFGAMRQISSVRLLLSYDPQKDAYPCIPVELQ